MQDTVLAKELLNGVWEGDLNKVKNALDHGASANWAFNGYPILIHAVYLEDEDMVRFLINRGACQLSEALGFALEYALGKMVWLLVDMGVLPKSIEVNEAVFGSHPNRRVAIPEYAR